MRKKSLGIGLAIAFLVIIILTLLAAPVRNQLKNGSTYSHAPDGYGAWYDYMQQRGTPLQRLQKPPKDWFKSSVGEKRTLIRVYSQPIWRRFSREEYRWLEKGNRMVILGIQSPVTPASFTSYLDSNSGAVRIDTTRREKYGKPILGDSFGSVVWEENITSGAVIYVSTPHLAANAYQDNRGNYEFLAQLVNQANYPLWIDEYLHGYKDKDVIEQEVGANLWSYWLKTPVLLLFFQGLVILLFAIWSGNRRLGKAVTLTIPTVNNSEAYIDALARVLSKANSSNFVVNAIAQAETKQLQKELGLETSNLEVIIDYWIQQKGGDTQELITLIKTAKTKKKLSDTELLNWLNTWHKIKKLIVDN